MNIPSFVQVTELLLCAVDVVSADLFCNLLQDGCDISNHFYHHLSFLKEMKKALELIFKNVATASTI